MSNQHDDQELQRHLDGLSEVSQAYARLPDESPGAALDERILAAARREAARPRRPAWMVPTALAATLMLALSLSWQQLRSPTSSVHDARTLEPAAPAAGANHSGSDAPLRADDASSKVADGAALPAQTAPPDDATSPAALDRTRLDSELGAAWSAAAGDAQSAAADEAARSPGVAPRVSTAVSDMDASADPAARRPTPVPPAAPGEAPASRAAEMSSVGAEDGQRQTTTDDSALLQQAREVQPARNQVEASRSAFASTAAQADAPSRPSAESTAKAEQPANLSGYRLAKPQVTPESIAMPELPERTRARPDTFLAAIRARHDRGAIDEARMLLGEFRERYPHYPLPEDFPLAEPAPAPTRD